MNKLLDKLSEYEDFELAFLVKYKIDSYLSNTQHLVMQYIEDKGLTKDKIL